MYEIFNFSSEGVNLSGRIDFSVNTKSPFVLYIHGINGDAISKKTDYLSDAFMQNGFHFIRINYRSSLQKGTFDNFCLNDDILDTRNAIEYLSASKFKMKKFGIIGKSFGGLRALLLDNPNITCFGFLAPAIFLGKEDTVQKFLHINYGSIGKAEDFKFEISRISQWKVPTIIIHGDSDEVIPVENSQILLNAISIMEKKLEIVSSAGHSFEKQSEKEIVSGMLVDFFKKYLLST